MKEDLKKLLQDAGIEVDEALRRFLGNEALYIKFLLKFPKDKSYMNLISAIEDNNLEEAFKSAHTLKGVAGNLSLNNLYNLLIPYVEILREGDLEAAKTKLAELEKAYTTAIQGIFKLD